MNKTGPDGEPTRIARGLLRRQQRGTLATNMRGAPYASLVLITADLDASPLLLLSDLAQHSRNIAFDPRVSILFDGTAGYQDPLPGWRRSAARRRDRPARLPHPGAHPRDGAFRACRTHQQGAAITPALREF